MEYESKELIKIYEHLSKKGIKTSEDELLVRVKRKKSEEILKRWLETSVEVEKTDAFKEHNSVI